MLRRNRNVSEVSEHAMVFLRKHLLAPIKPSFRLEDLRFSLEFVHLPWDPVDSQDICLLETQDMCCVEMKQNCPCVLMEACVKP